MRVLVVGGTGVVGAALVQHLERAGVEVAVMTRTPVAHPDWVRGDVRVPDLALPPATGERLRREVTHVVSCFGSVSLDAGPQRARNLHAGGTRNLLSFFGTCRDPQRFLHVSSVLVAGRSERWFANADLDVGQAFRSWYEYGKFEAEREVRRVAEELPVRVLRFGPVLGGDGPAVPSLASGLPAALPYLLKQLPAFIGERGDFPSYASDSLASAKVAADLLFTEDAPLTSTYFDPSMITLNETLTGLCAAWNVIPRVVRGNRLLRDLSGLIGPAFGLPHPLAEYLRPWARVDRGVLDELPDPEVRGPDRFVERTSYAIRERGGEVISA